MSKKVHRKKETPRIEFMTQTLIDANAEYYKKSRESNYDRRNKLIQ